MNFPSHDQDSAPEASKPLLAESQKAFGRLPGLHDFDAEELTVVWQSINVENECHYCVPAHTGIAKMMKVSDEISDALRNETALPTPKLEALRTFTVQMVRNRGFVSDEQMKTFFDAGYSHRAVLDVILGMAQKTISNYVNHVAETPVDEVFQPLAWKRGDNKLDV